MFEVKSSGNGKDFLLELSKAIGGKKKRRVHILLECLKELMAVHCNLQMVILYKVLHPCFLLFLNQSINLLSNKYKNQPCRYEVGSKEPPKLWNLCQFLPPLGK